MRRVVAWVTLLIVLIAVLPASADEHELFIICNPNSYVCVRGSPDKGAERTGLLDCGDSVITDGEKKNGFLHILWITEADEGWVFLGYVVEDKPIIETVHANVAATGRVAARRYIGGKRRCWVNVCSEVKVYARTDEWAVTNKGFIQSQYLEIWYE